MTTELILLGWTLVLALAQIAIAATFRTIETGNAYNLGPRDEKGPPKRPITGRLQRAQANLFETLPLFAAALLIAHVTGRENHWTLLGAQIYLAARVVYVALYAAGIPIARTLVWLASIAGLVMILLAILH